MILRLYGPGKRAEATLSCIPQEFVIYAGFLAFSLLNLKGG